MPTAKRHTWRSLRTWLALAAGLWLLAGCASLCNKHLFIYREAPQKQPLEQVALLITDPNAVQAIMPGAALDLQGAQWAPEQPSYSKEVYRLSIEEVDGQRVYQGRCMDSPPSVLVEVRGGNRRIMVRADRFGPWGMEKFTDTVQLNLQPGRAYFVRPDWQELLNKRLVIKLEPLPEAYTSLLRARVIDWVRKTNKAASLD